MLLTNISQHITSTPAPLYLPLYKLINSSIAIGLGSFSSRLLCSKNCFDFFLSIETTCLDFGTFSLGLNFYFA